MKEQTYLNKGLSSEEVKLRQKNGETNAVKSKAGKSYFSILISNLFTYFNAVFALFAILLISVGEYKQLTFLPVIFANLIIGIFQQMRSKAVLDRLTLLDKSTYVAVRDGKQIKLISDELVLGDLILLEAGQQIPADCIVESGEISVNESLLTGEADEIEKHEKSELLSGSFVVSGSAYATLVKVGENSYSAKLTRQAKEIKDKKSEMIKDIDRIILCAGIIIIPMGILLFCQSHFANASPISESIKDAIGALIGMIPEGLHLLTTIALALSAIRLAQNHVLLHDMRSVETLARVDVLCVDKTGTITKSEMSVSDVLFPDRFRDSIRCDKTSDDKNKNNEITSLLCSYLGAITDENATTAALKKYFSEKNGYNKHAEFLPEKIENFSSKTKRSRIFTKDAEFLLGAPEFVLEANDLDKYKPVFEHKAENGERVLAFCKKTRENLNSGLGDGDLANENGGKTEFCIFICLNNELRENAADIFGYFEKQGVAVKVISGDNPVTVSQIAKKAGIKNAEAFADASTLVSDEDILEAVKTKTVFGRVKPEQKKQIVLALKSLGMKVAMTGDGVNDILAMKEADCSISMGSGSDAAREASQVVLMDNDFSHMKQIVSEGRRDINNITRTATLFLYKNIFSILLSVFSLIFAISYPLDPVHVSFVSLFNVGMPAFLLTLEPNEKKQSGKFIIQTLIRAFPAAFGAWLASAALVFLGRNVGLSGIEQSTLTLLALSTAGYLLLFQAMHPITLYRAIVAAICVLGFIAALLILGDWAGLCSLTLKTAGIWAILALFEAIITYLVPFVFDKINRKRSNKNIV